MSSRPDIHIQASYLTFIVIFSTMTSFHHYFSTSHITTYYTHLLSFSSLLLTWHYPCFTLSGGFSRVTTWRIVTFFPPVHPMGNGSEISVWEVALLVRIHVTSVHGECLFIWLCISCEIIQYWSEYAWKKKDSALFILLFSIGHVYGRASLLHWVHMLERVRMRASFWDSILVYFGWEYESPIQFLWERQATFL